MDVLDVRRVGHVNHVAKRYDDVLGRHRDVLGGVAFREWDQVDAGTKNVLITVSDTCIEVFAAAFGDGPTASWIQRHGTGWQADWLSSLTGGPQTAVEDRPGLGGRSIGVSLPGHLVEFMEPTGDGPLRDLVESGGARIHSVVFSVADVERARDHLQSVGVPTEPGATEEAVAIAPSATAGARYELRLG